MKVSFNHHLNLDMMPTPAIEFPELYKAVREDPLVEIKLARLDVTNLDKATLFVFRRKGLEGVGTVSPISNQPREMPSSQKFMYKWLAPTMQKARGVVETFTGSAADWSDANERNLLMFESAQPLAELYSPLLHVDDTFVLQEYFVPQSQFNNWVIGAKPLYARALQNDYVVILNTTVRTVERDTWSALPYSVSSEGSVAFVLYYRILRTARADAELKTFHHDFVELTLSLGGRFYLPYRWHYTSEQLLRAYPEFPAWVAAKQEHDPECLFTSEWFDHYGMPFWTGTRPQRGLPLQEYKSDSPPLALWLQKQHSELDASFQLPVVSSHRQGSVSAIMNDPLSWRAFQEEFLVHIFSLRDNIEISASVAQAVYRARSRGGGDAEAYAILRQSLQASSGVMTVASQAWRGINQVHGQRRELLREVRSLFGKLGVIGKLHGMVCVGDPGKLVREIQEELGVDGPSWVVNDIDPDAGSEPDLNSVLVRRSLHPVGTFLQFDYSAPSVADVPDASVDVITMLQGLHHMPQDRLMGFLADMRRALRPGGLLIVREHNAEDHLVPMCDLAHWVFNAVTGVSCEEEAREVVCSMRCC
jgi:SAM-dependent methyltransferase